MDIDKVITETTQSLVGVINNSGLTLGIIRLILLDLLNMTMTQISNKAAKEVTENGDG